MYRRLYMMDPEVSADELKLGSNEGIDQETLITDDNEGFWFRYNWEIWIIYSDRESPIPRKNHYWMNMGPVIGMKLDSILGTKDKINSWLEE